MRLIAANAQFVSVLSTGLDLPIQTHQEAGN